MTEPLDGDALQREIAGHNARNLALLDSIKESGVSLDMARTVDVFFWAPSRESAGILVERLKERGFVELVAGPSAEGDEGVTWSVQGQLYEPPRRIASTAFTEGMVTLAAECGGATYDGWGTLLHEDDDHAASQGDARRK